MSGLVQSQGLSKPHFVRSKHLFGGVEKQQALFLWEAQVDGSDRQAHRSSAVLRSEGLGWCDSVASLPNVRRVLVSTLITA